MPIPKDTITALRFILRVFALDNLTAVRKPRSGSVGSGRAGRGGLVYLGKPSRLITGVAIPRIIPKHADKAALPEGVPKAFMVSSVGHSAKAYEAAAQIVRVTKMRLMSMLPPQIMFD